MVTLRYTPHQVQCLCKIASESEIKSIFAEKNIKATPPLDIFVGFRKFSFSLRFALKLAQLWVMMFSLPMRNIFFHKSIFLSHIEF